MMLHDILLIGAGIVIGVPLAVFAVELAFAFGMMRIWH